MTTVDAMADEIMKGLTDYADLADTSMKKAVRKTAKSVKNEISANAPKKTGAYSKSWTAKKTKENSHSLEMTVHSKNRINLHIYWRKVMLNVAVDVYPANHTLLLRKKKVYSFLRNLSRRPCHDLRTNQ